MNLKNPLVLALAAAATVAAVAYFGKKAIKEVAAGVGGVVSGNNALTRNTPYAGAGLPGTVGAATNAASGGALQRTGEAIGEFLFGALNRPYDPNAKAGPIRFERDAQTLVNGAAATDRLWGPIGNVELRTL